MHNGNFLILPLFKKIYIYEISHEVGNFYTFISFGESFETQGIMKEVGMLLFVLHKVLMPEEQTFTPACCATAEGLYKPSLGKVIFQIEGLELAL